MYFYDQLFVGESVRGKEKKICKKLKRGAGMIQVYVITLNMGSDLFDIYHCAFFKQKAFRKRPFCIIGLAGSHKEAVSMVTDIVQDIYQKSGNTDFKAYFLDAMR